MKILFITATRIGDAVLSTGVLRHIHDTYPDARVSVACGALSASLFEGFEQVERIIAMRKKKRHGHWIDLWQRAIGTRWDMVIDLRNSAVSRLIFAKQRFVYGVHIDRARHKVEQNAAVLGVLDGAQYVPAPWLCFSEAQRLRAQEILSARDHKRPLIGVGPAANWRAKTWPLERFIALSQWLIDECGLYEGAQVAVFGAPGEEAISHGLYDALPEDARLDVIAKGSPADAAACLAKCDFYVGNDSGLMHAAAACGVKTFGLFGPSYPHLYRPWGTHTHYARTPQSFDALIDYDGYSPETAPCLMEGLTLEVVKAAIEDMQRGAT